MRGNREYCSKGHRMDDAYRTTRRDGRIEYQCRPCKKAQSRRQDVPARDVNAELIEAQGRIVELERELLDAYRKLSRAK